MNRLEYNKKLLMLVVEKASHDIFRHMKFQETPNSKIAYIIFT